MYNLAKIIVASHNKFSQIRLPAVLLSDKATHTFRTVLCLLSYSSLYHAGCSRCAKRSLAGRTSGAALATDHSVSVDPFTMFRCPNHTTALTQLDRSNPRKLRRCTNVASMSDQHQSPIALGSSGWLKPPARSNAQSPPIGPHSTGITYD